MPVPAAITDLDTVAANNSPAGTDPIGATLDDYLRAHASFIAQLNANKLAKSGGAMTNGTVDNTPIGNTTRSTVKGTSGDFNAGLAVSGGAVDISGASAGQVKFPVSQNASSDANTLDDYEEGTWTPSLTFGGDAAGMTFNARAGTYRKIGSLVQVQCYVYLSAKGSSVGAAGIQGLPFSVNSQVNGYCAATFWAAGVSSSGAVEAYASPGSTQITLQQLSSAGVNSGLDNTNFTNSTEMMLNICYQTN